MLKSAWTLSQRDALAHFGTAEDRGLTEEQVKSSREVYGENALPEAPPTSLFQLILAQFQDQLVLILLGSAIVSFVLALFEDSSEPGGSWMTAFVEPLVIFLILIANATVGVIQETNAEKAIDALREYSPDEALALRSGQLRRIPATQLVPGDIVSVHVGDRIPADCRILSFSSSSFRVDQAMLTGESMSVGKTDSTVSDASAVKQDMVNMLFSGTTVVNGAAKALVVATGSNTALGAIHSSISDDNKEEEKTPLKRKLDDFGEQLAKVISVICILVWLVNIRHFSDPSHHGWLKGAVYYLKIAVALAVAAIPEGLAAVITACLALGTKKMAKRGAIVRNLPSVETLGCANVICSDKTGTLTTNQMSVARFSTIDGDNVIEYLVGGTTFAPIGSITTLDGKTAEKSRVRTAPVNKLVEICAVCNDAKIAYNQDTDTYANVGEPTEAALKVLVEKLASDSDSFNDTLSDLAPLVRATAVNDHYDSRIQRLLTFEFTRDRKSMSVLTRSGDSHSLLVKGAPETVIERCTKVITPSGVVALTPNVRRTLAETQLDYGKRGLRTLALAYIDENDGDVSHYKTEKAEDYVRFEQEMTFVGLVGMLDPPRPEVREAIAKCKTAGIRTIVITGDNKNTAETICREIGVFGPDEDLTGKSYTGKELDALSQDEKVKAVQRASLFSRTEPNHKSQLVDLLQGLGLVVAMTGDGVNDAPALKKADIGIAMGSGTDVAKLAADMVLATDNFATIEKAVEEGRAIYNNTKQFIRYLISSNIGEVVSIFLTVLLGMPEALIPVQLLWVNLITDGLPATALGFNPPDHQIMKTPPRSASEPLVGRWLFFRYMVIGTYVGAATVFGYAWWFMFYSQGPQITFHELTHFHQCSSAFSHLDCSIFASTPSQRATTVSLSILVVIEMFNACNSLSENESLLALPIWTNPYLVASIALSMGLHFMILYVPFFRTLFQITPLNWEEWKAVLWISFPVIIIDEVLKWISTSVLDQSSIESSAPLSVNEHAVNGNGVHEKAE
ncbi:putative calcium-transporting ATPase sarcoplasmic/endoplasmic reticulum type [Kockovaella imperatae]|uniref:Calcium-transporting ATPase n=1 Tax=Kockovaella imperatae TaxID=4999 RepID=A0A1Y1UFK9_9TREE|nr:putative calcium-transporting ATPase sarcoplasmic/endoplasmic reticulum type [Kockovaella imperatae]ORX36317.1 putative calcium-transporting ATPase sarcoplasmic/endoplasmic reticulum type [Kockovaella imperatae]